MGDVEKGDFQFSKIFGSKKESNLNTIFEIKVWMKLKTFPRTLSVNYNGMVFHSRNDSLKPWTL